MRMRVARVLFYSLCNALWWTRSSRRDRLACHNTAVQPKSCSIIRAAANYALATQWKCSNKQANNQTKSQLLAIRRISHKNVRRRRGVDRHQHRMQAIQVVRWIKFATRKPRTATQRDVTYYIAAANAWKSNVDDYTDSLWMDNGRTNERIDETNWRVLTLAICNSQFSDRNYDCDALHPRIRHKYTRRRALHTYVHTVISKTLRRE
jgi:hypothetical protein